MNLISVTRIRRSRRKISTTLPKEVADLVGIGEEDKLLGWAEKDGKIYLVPECEVKEFLREKLYGLRPTEKVEQPEIELFKEGGQK